MDDKKTGLVADWPKPIHLDEKWAAWIGAVQQRIEALEAQKLDTAAECWTRLDELAESAAADNRRRNDEKRRNDSFDGPSARLRHDEGMPSERAPLARSPLDRAMQKQLAELLGLELSESSWQDVVTAVKARGVRAENRKLQFCRLLNVPYRGHGSAWEACERAIEARATAYEIAERELRTLRDEHAALLLKTPAAELVGIAQRETIYAYDMAHATREQLRTVEAELAAVLKLCADLIEPIDVRQTPSPVKP